MSVDALFRPFTIKNLPRPKPIPVDAESFQRSESPLLTSRSPHERSGRPR